jgi:hypothetical protein
LNTAEILQTPVGIEVLDQFSGARAVVLFRLIVQRQLTDTTGLNQFVRIVPVIIVVGQTGNLSLALNF